jgi:hypothetical protein
MKDYLLDLALAATVLAIALGYYFGHGFINRLMADGPIALMQLAGR